VQKDVKSESVAGQISEVQRMLVIMRSRRERVKMERGNDRYHTSATIDETNTIPTETEVSKYIH
jgi:hypothetical protein